MKGGSSEKGHEHASLELKVASHTGDFKLFVEAMRFYPIAMYLNTRTYALEGSELFGSIKRGLDLPLRFEYDSHCLEKVDYSIRCPNTRSIRAHIEEFLTHDENVVSHTTSVSKIPMAHF